MYSSRRSFKSQEDYSGSSMSDNSSSQSSKTNENETVDVNSQDNKSSLKESSSCSQGEGEYYDEGEFEDDENNFSDKIGEEDYEIYSEEDIVGGSDSESQNESSYIQTEFVNSLEERKSIKTSTNTNESTFEDWKTKHMHTFTKILSQDSL